MFGYCLDMALRSLKRNPVLTALMVLAIGLGIGVSMTTLTVFHPLSADPPPGRSGRLFHPQVDPKLPGAHALPGLLTYVDAMNLWQAQRADRQAILVGVNVKVKAAETGAQAMGLHTRATTADFFPMFGVSSSMAVHGKPPTMSTRPARRLLQLFAVANVSATRPGRRPCTLARAVRASRGSQSTYPFSVSKDAA